MTKKIATMTYHNDLENSHNDLENSHNGLENSHND